MADIEDQKQSETVRVVGSDEEFAADVIDSNGKRLLVSGLIPAGSSSGCPAVTNAYRLDTVGNVALARSINPYTTIYSYSGTGALLAFSIAFNDEDVFVRLEIDGQEIFEIDCDDLESYTDGDDGGRFGSIYWHRDENRFVFKPDCAIVYTTNVTIQGRANSDTSSRDANFTTVELTKVT